MINLANKTVKRRRKRMKTPTDSKLLNYSLCGLESILIKQKTQSSSFRVNRNKRKADSSFQLIKQHGTKRKLQNSIEKTPVLYN